MQHKGSFWVARGPAGIANERQVVLFRRFDLGWTCFSKFNDVGKE